MTNSLLRLENIYNYFYIIYICFVIKLKVYSDKSVYFSIS